MLIEVGFATVEGYVRLLGFRGSHACCMALQRTNSGSSYLLLFESSDIII